MRSLSPNESMYISDLLARERGATTIARRILIGFGLVINIGIITALVTVIEDNYWMIVLTLAIINAIFIPLIAWLKDVKQPPVSQLMMTKLKGKPTVHSVQRGTKTPVIDLIFAIDGVRVALPQHWGEAFANAELVEAEVIELPQTELTEKFDQARYHLLSMNGTHSLDEDVKNGIMGLKNASMFTGIALMLVTVYIAISFIAVVEEDEPFPLFKLFDYYQYERNAQHNFDTIESLYQQQAHEKQTIKVAEAYQLPKQVCGEFYACVVSLSEDEKTAFDKLIVDLKLKQQALIKLKKTDKITEDLAKELANNPHWGDYDSLVNHKAWERGWESIDEVKSFVLTSQIKRRNTINKIIESEADKFYQAFLDYFNRLMIIGRVAFLDGPNGYALQKISPDTFISESELQRYIDYLDDDFRQPRELSGMVVATLPMAVQVDAGYSPFWLWMLQVVGVIGLFLFFHASRTKAHNKSLLAQLNAPRAKNQPIV